MVSREMVDALGQVRRKVSAAAWQQVIERIEGATGKPTPASIQIATDHLLNLDAAWILSKALEECVDVPWTEIASVMATVGLLVGDNVPLTELIWSGPSNDKFSIRRIDQVLYDLIASATRRIVLVTFAAYKVPHLCDHLTDAVNRGVDLTLIVESEAESDGQLSMDAIAAFGSVPLTQTKVYYWPFKMREKNASGNPGKLHIKCAIVDDVALVGSANMTDDAFNRNMELGVIVRESATVFAVAGHFRELITSGILVEVKRGV